MSTELNVFEGKKQVAGILVDSDSIMFWSDHEYLDEFLQEVQATGLPRFEENEDERGILGMKEIPLKVTDKTIEALILNLVEKDFIVNRA